MFQTTRRLCALAFGRSAILRPLAGIVCGLALAPIGPAWSQQAQDDPAELGPSAAATIDPSDTTSDATPPLAAGTARQDNTEAEQPFLTSALPARKLAEGVLVVVPPDQQAGDTTIGPIDLPYVDEHPELRWSPPTFADGTPNTMSSSETLSELGRDVTLRHPVWGLEFAFKPMRLIRVPVATATGVERKLVWYLVYRVRYTGGDLLPKEQAVEAGIGIPESPQRVYYESVRFLPRFVLTSTEFDRSYDSQIITTAKGPIADRERVGQPLRDIMEMSATPIKPVSESENPEYWGIATWADLDPRMDAFYVDVRGLTNAYHLAESPNGELTFPRKTLRIYFWKPGDTIEPDSDRISLGVPAFESQQRQQEILRLFKLQEPQRYQWLYEAAKP